MTATYPDLRGRAVFITGGGSGIGAALTEGFVAQGARVAFVQRSDAGAFCDGVAARQGARPLFLPCDITDIAALRAAIAAARDALGPIEVLVNNAASDDRHDLFGYGPEEWDRSIAINLRPHYFTAQAVAPDMIAAGRGAIINVSSISYMMGNAEYPAYVAAKAGITGLTRGLARELGRHGIRVNALVPGWVLTERQRRLWVTEEGLNAHLARQCLPFTLEEAHMVGPCLFLASGAAAAVTGQALVADGGVVVTG